MWCIERTRICLSFIVAAFVLNGGCYSINPDLIDYDGDGVPDINDAFPADPGEHTDRDGDGVGDNADAFPDDPARTETVDEPDDGDTGDDTDGGGNGENGDSGDNGPPPPDEPDEDGGSKPGGRR